MVGFRLLCILLHQQLVIDAFPDIVEQLECVGDYFPFESGIFAAAFMLLSSPRPMVMHVQFIWSAV